jgi:hypothetical protein
MLEKVIHIDGTRVYSTLEVSKKIYQTHQKVKEKAAKLGVELIELESEFGRNHKGILENDLELILRSYLLTLKNGKLAATQSLVNSLGLPVNPVNSENLLKGTHLEVNPVKSTQLNKAISVDPTSDTKQPALVNLTEQSSGVKQETEELVASSVNRPKDGEWFNPIHILLWIVSELMKPISLFFRTNEGVFFIVVAVIILQSIHLALSYIDKMKGEIDGWETLFGILFGLLFEFSGLVLSMNKGKPGYLIGFGLVSVLVNLNFFGVITMPYFNELVISVGLPLSIYAFADLYNEKEG